MRSVPLVRSALRLLAAAPVAALFTAAPPAFAQSIGPLFADEARGMALYTTGTQRLHDGDWSGAVDALGAAWTLTRRADVLPQLAKAYEGLGDLGRAADTWASYRDRAPIAERDVVSARIASLRAVAPSPPLGVDSVEPPLPPPVSARAERPGAATPWVVAGLGGGLAAAGFTVAATGEGPGWDSAHPLDRVGVSTAVAGASVGLTGLVWAAGRAVFGGTAHPVLTVNSAPAE